MKTSTSHRPYTRRLSILLACLLALFALPATALASTTGGSGGSSGSDEIPYIEFVNVPNNTPDLFVRKTVVSAASGYELPDAEFYFTLKVRGQYYAKQRYYVYDSTGAEIHNYADSVAGQVEVPFETDINGGFTLKAGQTAKFPYVGRGAEYEVIESHDDERFVQTSPVGDAPQTGVVSATGSSAVFENTYYPENEEPPEDPTSETTRLQVTKNALLPPGYEVPDTPDFTFELLISGVPWQNQYYDIADSTGSIIGDSYTDATGRFTLKGGQTAIFDDIPVDVDYTVHELINEPSGASPSDEGWRLVSSITPEGATKQPITNASFTNAFASFAVMKRLSDYSSPEVSFTFVLTDGNGAPMSDVQYYLYDSSKQLISSDTHRTSSDGAFELLPNQLALFIGIDPGTAYNVREQIKTGYAQQTPLDAKGYTGRTVREDMVEVLEFVNQSTVETGSLTVTKTVENAPDEFSDSSFTFTVTLSDKLINGKYGDMEFESGVATFDLKDGESMAATNLPAGTKYKVEEAPADMYDSRIDEPEGAIDADEPAVVEAVNTFVGGGILPTTGGEGLLPTILLGLAMLGVGASILYFRRRRYTER